MQLKYAILVGALAVLASPAVPALARHSDAPQTGAQPTSSSCSARQQTADGTWTQLPCQELTSPEQAPHKSATRNPDHQTR
jgi:hypothetical protein